MIVKGKRLEIVVNDDGVLRLFWGDREIGSMYDGSGSIIRYVEMDDEPLVLLKNMFGGLHEAEHEYIGYVVKKTMRVLKRLGIRVEIEGQIGEG